MNSIVVHYKELALKGRNRPWFIQQLVRNLQDALRDLDVGAVRSLMGRIDIELGTASNRDSAEARLAREEVRERIRPHFRHRQLLVCRDARRTISRRWRRRSWPTSASTPASFRVQRPARGQAAPVHVAGDRARGRRPHQGSEGWRVDLDDPALTIHLEMLPDHAFYYLRQGARRRRIADRDRRPRGLSALWRDRLAGRRVPDDAARLLGPADPFSQLSDSVAAPRRRRSARSRRC